LGSEHRSNFKTPQGEASYLAAYEATLTLWPIPYQSLQVLTRWGHTHVIACGPKDAPPLVLLHGMSLSATMWFANVADLGQKHRLYAVDTIGSAGKSVAVQPLTNRADLAGWLDDVLDGLQLAQTHILGHSFGGWLALNFVLSASQRVKRLILLSPAASLLPLVGQFWLRGIPAMLFAHRSLIARFMDWMTADRFAVNALFVEQFVLGIRHFRSQIRILPTVFTDNELRQIKLPTLLLIGEQEVIYDPAAAVDRAKHLISNIKAELIPNASHGLPMEQSELVNARILGFIDRVRAVSE
jgi:pimeloyl-ACP methyl ester carboxylesterase